MAEKHLSLRIDEKLLKEFLSVAKYYGRSGNSQLLIMIRQYVNAFKEKHGIDEKSAEP